tara:strand:+ start:78 stop:644 length:567 start_codon:yes stop_codon:yes gene_type:complete
MTDKLNSTWTLWYHNATDKNWDLNSYKNIYEFNTIESFWKLINTIDKHYSNYGNDMLFLMRKKKEKYIYPMWEDKENKNGGYWSFKIDKSELNDIWNHIMILLIGENILNDKELNNKMINGISISPKKNNCILKIWNKKNDYKEISILNKIDKLDYENVLYKSHNDNIKQDLDKINNNKVYYSGRRQK